MFEDDEAPADELLPALLLAGADADAAADAADDGLDPPDVQADATIANTARGAATRKDVFLVVNVDLLWSSGGEVAELARRRRSSGATRSPPTAIARIVTVTPAAKRAGAGRASRAHFTARRHGASRV
jgi:hypothetical protein